jgi:hypothetical protein
VAIMAPMRVVSHHHALGPNSPWFAEDNGKRLAHDRELVVKHYPQLLYEMEDQQVARLRGQLLFVSDSGITTRVAVRIDFPDRYPELEPIAFDDENRFPAELDRHLLSDGRCCLWLPVRSRWKQSDPDALLAFLDEVALFFDRQLVYDATGRKNWPGGEYPHGRDGYIEFLIETLAIDRLKLDALAPALLNRTQPERSDPCPCGSGRKFKRCHAVRIWEVQKTIHSGLMTAILC